MLSIQCRNSLAERVAWYSQVHVCDLFSQRCCPADENDVRAQLKAFAEKHIAEEVVYKHHIAEGKPYATILDYAERLGLT